MPARRRAFTLTEVGVALAILCLAFLPIVDLLVGARRQVRQSGDLDLALTVEDKVAEELRLASWENVHLLDEAPAADGSSQPAPVVNGVSPYFAAIEDATPPFGRIRAGEDPGISPKMPTLFDALKSFKVGVGSRPRQLPTTGALLDLEVAVEWSDFQQLAARQLHAISLPARSGARADPPVVDDRVKADAAIAAALFPDDRDRPLAGIAAARGASLPALRQVGDLVLVVTALRDADQALSARLAAPPASAVATPFGTLSGDQALARQYEAHAAAYLGAILYLAPVVSALAASFDPAQLGNPPPARLRLAPTAYLTALVPSLADDLQQLRLILARCYAAAGVRPRARTRIFMKLLAVCKMEALVKSASDLTPISRMLADFLELHEGRNPNFFAFALFEADHCKDLASLRASYADPGWIQAVSDVRDSAARAAARVQR